MEAMDTPEKIAGASNDSPADIQAEYLARGNMYFVSGIVRTDAAPYAVLMDTECSRFLPIVTTAAYAGCIENILGFKPDPNASISMFVTVQILLKAVGVTIGRFSLMLADDGLLSVVLDLYQANEASICVGRVPIIPQDACILSALTLMPFAVFERQDNPITIAIGKDDLDEGTLSPQEFMAGKIRELEAKIEASKKPLAKAKRGKPRNPVRA